MGAGGLAAPCAPGPLVPLGAVYLISGGGFAAAAASGFLSDQKATKESPGDGSGEHQVVLLVACPPDPRLRGSLVRKLGGNVPARGGL